MSPGFKTALLLIMTFGAPALAQGLDDKALHARDAAPNMPRTQDTVPDRMRMDDPATTGSTRPARVPRDRPGLREESPGSHGRTRGG